MINNECGRTMFYEAWKKEFDEFNEFVREYCEEHEADLSKTKQAVALSRNGIVASANSIDELKQNPEIQTLFKGPKEKMIRMALLDYTTGHLPILPEGHIRGSAIRWGINDS